MRNQRKKIWIDRFQTYLFIRIAAYCVLYQAAVWILVGIERSIFVALEGLVGPGEKPEETALREVAEETGVEARSLGKLGDVRYVYTRRGGERVFKVVSFYLLRYRRGRLGDLPPELAFEVAEARWLPADEAPRLLAYKGERDMAERALARLREGAYDLRFAAAP